MNSRSLWCAWVALVGLSAAACDIPVAFGQKIEGEISESDEHSTDSNDLVFYWDNYFADFKEGTTYDVELWSVDADPIHFEIKKRGVDFTTTNNATFQYTSAASEQINFDIYLRYDYIGDGSKYAFKITPQ